MGATAAAAGSAFLYRKFLRQPILTWGATAEEAAARLPEMLLGIKQRARAARRKMLLGIKQRAERLAAEEKEPTHV
jgi:hypothetical protein